LAVLPVKADGSLEEPSQTIQHVGSGPNKSRQEKPHVHSVNISPDNKNLYVADLGTDIVTNYAFDEATGKLSKVQEMSVKAGSGPRHIAFHPNLPLMYVIQEMAGIITQFSVKDGMLTKVEEVSTLPKDFKGENSCADIHFSPDGKFLYGSNRFYDMIVTFAVDEQTGKLTQLSQTSVKGKVPRNFGITPDGKYLLVANQETDNIVIFERDAKTGALKDLNLELKISMPVCIKFLK
jgi:6-phosphogluconolactonase